MTELREAIGGAYAKFQGAQPDPGYWQFENGEDLADAVLALPEVAALRAKAAATDRARAEVETWSHASRKWYRVHCHDDSGTPYACGFEDGWDHAEKLLRRALDGEQP